MTRLKVCVAMQLEVRSVEISDIFCLVEFFEIILKGRELVVFSIVEREDRNAVLELEGIGVGCVVHQDHFFEVSVDK